MIPREPPPSLTFSRVASLQPTDTADGETLPVSDSALGLALYALQQHCRLFGPARLHSKKSSREKREETIASVGAYYHASSGVSSRHRAAKKRKPGRPKGSRNK